MSHQLQHLISPINEREPKQIVVDFSKELLFIGARGTENNCAVVSLTNGQVLHRFKEGTILALAINGKLIFISHYAKIHFL